MTSRSGYDFCIANKLQPDLGLDGLVLKVYVLALPIAHPNGGYLVTFS